MHRSLLRRSRQCSSQMILLVACTACATKQKAPETAPRSPGARSAANLAVARGQATYYADMFEGRRTASGIVFRNTEMYAAHRNYPFGTRVRVTNLKNGRSVIVRIVDRG